MYIYIYRFKYVTVKVRKKTGCRCLLMGNNVKVDQFITMQRYEIKFDGIDSVQICWQAFI